MITKKTEEAPRDVLIMMNDNGTADILNVLRIDHERLFAASQAGEYSVPLGDVKSFTGRRGRIFTLAGSFDYIQECQRLASLEKSIVLRQITQYQKPTLDEAKIDLKFILMIVVVIILIISLAVK